MKIVPLSDIKQKLIGTKILDIDIKQVATAAIDSVDAHHFEDTVLGRYITQIVHIDGSPHQWVFADLSPLRADVLGALQDLKCTQPRENRGRHVQGQLQPITSFAFGGGHSSFSFFSVFSRRVGDIVGRTEKRKKQWARVDS